MAATAAPFDPALPELTDALARFVRRTACARVHVAVGRTVASWPAAGPAPDPLGWRAARAALTTGAVRAVRGRHGRLLLAAGVIGAAPALVVVEPGAPRAASSALAPDEALAAFRDGTLAAALDAWRRRDPFAALEASSPALAGTLDLLRRIGPTTLSLLVLGETGTGKEEIARAAHASSGRAGRLVAENCAAVPESLLEAELFGVCRGAFTGADRDRPGRVVEAHGGTLFLDEIGDLPPALQAKLLRVLQEREVRALGADRARPVDVRVIAATHQPLAGVTQGSGFRRDLYYRLSGALIRLPPLRARPADLPFLVAALLARIAREPLGTGRVLAPRALARITHYGFPGNVRELDNLLRRAAALSPGPVIPAALLEPDPPPSFGGPENLEVRAIRDALVLARGSKADAARRLGWTRQRLYRRLARLGL